jgi:hypothetical protein
MWGEPPKEKDKEVVAPQVGGAVKRTAVRKVAEPVRDKREKDDV